jgi:hypothetical protein
MERNTARVAFALASIAFALALTVPAGSRTAAPCSGRPIQGQAQTAAPAVTAVPRFSHVIIIPIENKEFSEVIGNPLMPNFNGWAGRYALLMRYHAITHPSLPNYLALIGGDFFGIQDDRTNYSIDAPCLPGLLEASGRTWKAYLEGLPSPGFTGALSGKYVKKHNPFAYFDDLLKDPACLERNTVPLDAMRDDLAKGRLADFSFVMPDLCNSGHDCSLDVVDAWLGKVVGAILDSRAFDASTLIVLTFDEGSTDLGCCGCPDKAGGGRIATVLISPLVRPGFQDETPYSHYSLLKTLLAAWELPLIGHAAHPDVGLILEPWRRR